MVFSDLFFLFAFLPAFVVCYLIAAALGRGNTLKNLVLVLFSLVFYAWGEPVYVLLMVATVVMNYFAGLAVDAAQSHRKAAMATAVAMNVAVLGVFKYAGFIATTLNDVGISVPVRTPASRQSDMRTSDTSIRNDAEGDQRAERQVGSRKGD